MIFVTGGTGLVGAQLLLDLASSGKEVRAMHRPSSDFSVFKRLFSHNKALHDKISWVEGDLNDALSLERLINQSEEVYHCAGLVSFLPKDREKLYHINIEGTANLVNVCLEKQIRKLVYVSSVGALGRNSTTTSTINEDSHWQTSNENSDYAISKYGAEREIWRGIAEGLNAVIVNPSVIIGAGNWDSGSSKLVKQIWDGLRFYTNGISGFVDVKDVTAIMIQLMKSDVTAERFVVSSENISFKTFFEIASIAMNKKPPSFFAAPWMGELAWRLEAIRNLISRHQPLITKYTAINAHKIYKYDAGRIKQRLNYNFIPVKDSINNACKEFMLQSP